MAAHVFIFSSFPHQCLSGFRSRPTIVHTQHKWIDFFFVFCFQPWWNGLLLVHSTQWSRLHRWSNVSATIKVSHNVWKTKVMKWSSSSDVVLNRECKSLGCCCHHLFFLPLFETQLAFCFWKKRLGLLYTIKCVQIAKNPTVAVIQPRELTPTR